MSKRQFKSQASSSRAFGVGGFGGFGSTTGTSLAYLSEPPNLSSISDANVVVAFKNLTKKDGTTKTKGLEDLHSYVQSHPFEQSGGVEQSILDAWVKFYPRIAIDNSRRVRELSHNLQYELLKSARKRMEKYIPSIVGAWLAGTFDRDRPVSRAASDGITSFLDTEEKVLAFWRRCQPQILSYAQEAIAETPQTLSDERTVSPDDMKAKHDRVIGSSLSLVVNLLAKLGVTDIEKHQEAYESFLSNNKTLWNFAAGDDAFVRRTTCQLLIVSLQKQERIISKDIELVSGAFIADGLKAPQLSSNVQFLQTLNVLTAKYPQAWTSSYKNKKPPSSRLRHFIEKGSQAGPPDFWLLWTLLLKKLPEGVLPSDTKGVVEFLKAQRDGMSSREELRVNVVPAWRSYTESVKLFISDKADKVASNTIMAATVFPVFEQYVRPSVESSRWSTNNNTSILADLFELCAQDSTLASIQTEWQRLADLLVETMLTSLPEKSKDYSKSQNAVITEATRWFTLQAAILERMPNKSTTATLSGTTMNVISKATEMLVNRNGKPFGAAGTLESALKLSPTIVGNSVDVIDNITAFFEENLPKLVASPSSLHLVGALHAFRDVPGQQDHYKSIWDATMDGLLVEPVDNQRRSTVVAMISHKSAHHVSQENEELQKFVIKYVIKEALKGEIQATPILKAAISFDSLNSATANQITSDIVESLTIISESKSAFDLLEVIARHRPALLEDSLLRVTLMTKLLAVGESLEPDLVTRAASLRLILETQSKGITAPSDSIVQIIMDNLETANVNSLSIDTLTQQAIEALNSDGGCNAVDLFPEPETWLRSLATLLSYAPNPAIALTNALGGGVFLVQTSPTKLEAQPGRDSKGYSVAFRKALYVSELITTSKCLHLLPAELQVEMLSLLCVVVEVANDQLGLLESNKLWATLSTPEIELEVQDFLSATQRVLSSVYNNASSWRSTKDASTIAGALLSALLRGSQGRLPLSFYKARALTSLLSNAVELNGWQTTGGEQWLTSLDVLNTSTANVFEAAAVLTGLRESLGSSKVVNTLCNRLVSDIAGATLTSDKTLGLLNLLNAIATVYDTGDLPVAQNRLVFAVKQITTWMEETTEISIPLATEALRSLQVLLPCISSVYGSHWKITLNFCIQIMIRPAAGERLDGQLPIYHASMRLIVLCRNLFVGADAEEKNEDIEEALKQVSPDIPQGLLQILKLPRSKETQPWRIVDELLCRELESVPVSTLKEPEDIYPLLAADSQLVQLAAFDLLRRYALEKTESINYKTILEKQDATLPQELLSLLLDAPMYENYSEDLLVLFPAPIRSYLLSWHVVFDYYTNASYKVRNDYSECLKSENYVTPLLDFIFEVLGHSIARALNLENAGLTAEHVRIYNFKSASAESAEYDMQWLLVNLYYQCLKYVPSLAKTWWLDCKSKQTRIAVETWTEKFFSPLIIDDTLTEVAKWGEEQEAPVDDEKELLVKVSKKSKEVYAGYEVDDMQAQIVIRLPAIYPLEGVKVDSVHRVAVSEKKWQSWLMITQGVITFSNGSITDGLTIFRKNVMGALKGQTECAICYSIVSSDRKMPDKRCQTCKNLFHSSCLFKWFASSNQSTCPLCRNPFTYGETVRRRPRGE